jgi:hypothetical protein
MDQPSSAPTTTQPDPGTAAVGAGTDPAAGTAPVGDTQSQAQTQPSADQPAADQPAADQPAADGTADGQALSQVVPVLPTPTGEPTESSERLEEYFGKVEASGRHASGRISLGWAKDAGKYAAGKHSSGNYAEGKHAAVTRAHGSMAPVTLRQILGVLNGPMSGH